MANISSARIDILSSIRQNLETSRPFDAVYHEHYLQIAHVKPTARRAVSKTNLTFRFKENLESVGGKCWIVADEKEASGVIQNIFFKLQPNRIAFFDSPIVNRLVAPINLDAEILEYADKKSLFTFDIGITGAQWGIAETGTLVLESERERNRLISLLPPVHICVLGAKNILATMGEILETLQKDLNRTVTFVTGPSRTSDIELTLAIGVHGPRELYVIIIDDEAHV
jgi:L-lactate dehydrogenase complex protein LldG